MNNTIYFKDNDAYWKASFLEDESPDDPRRDLDEVLGTMVFKKRKNNSLGDIQAEDFSEFFLSQLKDEKNVYLEGHLVFKLPTLEEARKNESLERYIAGNKAIGERFDVDLFNQDMDYLLNDVKNMLDDKVCDNLTGGIPLDDNWKLTDSYEISFTTPPFPNETDAENAFNKIKKSILSELEERFSLNTSRVQSGYNWHSTVDDLTETQLFDKWAASKLAVIPIDVYEHGGITCHEASIRKTARASNDRDDGVIHNDGFIYIDKDDENYLPVIDKSKINDKDYLKKTAELFLREEIKQYASYLEGDVHTLAVDVFDRKKLDWVESHREYIYGSDLESVLKDDGYSIENRLSEDDVKKLENTVTKEFQTATGEKFLSDIKAALPEFDGSVLNASRAVLYSLKKNGSSALELVAISGFLKDNGCSSDEKTIAFLNEALGLKEKGAEQNLLPFKGEKLSCYYSKINNPNRSDNGGVNNILIVDYDNKRFGFASGVSQMIDTPSECYYRDVERLKSGKSVEKKVEFLARAGFKNTKLDAPALEGYQRDDKWIKKYVMHDKEIER